MELVFARVSSRLFRARPRALAFAADCPASCSDPAWSPYRASPVEVVPSLHAGQFRLFEGLVEFKDLSAVLWSDEGYVCEYAARAQALRRLLVPFRAAAVISRRNRAIMTLEAFEGLAACSKVMCRGS